MIGENYRTIDYTLAQFGVIAHYLWLCFWPHPLVVDYGLYTGQTAWQIVPYAAIDWRPAGGRAWRPFVISPGWVSRGSGSLPILRAEFQRGALVSANRRREADVSAPGGGGDRRHHRRLSCRSATHRSRHSLAVRSANHGRRPDTACRHCLGNAHVGPQCHLPRSSIDLGRRGREDAGQRSVHNNLAVELLAVGRADKAITHCRKALELKPRFVDPYNNLGMAPASCGRTQDAITQYRKAVELKPDYAEVHNNLGNVLAVLNRVDEAMAEYRKALQLKPDYIQPYVNLGVAYVKQGRTAEAMAEYRKALELDPDDAEAHNNLGNVLAELKRSDDAMAEYREALPVEPQVGTGALLLRAAPCSIVESPERPLSSISRP